MGATEPEALPKLRRNQKKALLSLARNAIAQKLGRPAAFLPEAEDTSGLDLPYGAFVSLHVDGRLRGCIGTMEASGPLLTTIEEMAVAAATQDPRFPPMSSAELRDTDIEVSVLTPMRPIRPEDVEVGRHGLLVRRGHRHGVLLPQVATQYGWDAPTFLAQVCRKAGLPETAWREDGTVLLAFEAEVFSEDGLAREERELAL